MCLNCWVVSFPLELYLKEEGEGWIKKVQTHVKVQIKCIDKVGESLSTDKESAEEDSSGERIWDHWFSQGEWLQTFVKVLFGITNDICIVGSVIKWL